MEQRYQLGPVTNEAQRSPFAILVDQAGYFPQSVKKAVMHAPHNSFQIVDAKGQTRYEGKVLCLGYDENAGETVYAADFSSFTETGDFHVVADNDRSAAFRIAEDVYAPVLRDVTKAYYYLRCGCALEEAYAGPYTHAPCHTANAVLWEDHAVSLDVSGGWHDAGDYGRYVTAGACAVAHLLYAYMLYPDVFEKLDLRIPESSSVLPDLLCECRIELEWLLKMQRENGAVYHKVTTALHAPFVMPEDDTDPLYVFPVSTMSTADFAAVCALASRVYAPFDAAFAQRLRSAAEKTAAWLTEHPAFIGFMNPPGCNTGGYGEWDDHSNRFWAYAEMYALTGETRWHDAMIRSLDERFPLFALGYGEVGGLGAMAYLFCDQKKDDALQEHFKAAFLGAAQKLQEAAERCGYGCSMQTNDYHWGSNMTLMKQGMVFAIADKLTNTGTFRANAEAQLHTLLGVNALGYSYVTGTGEFCCNHPHLRPAHADGIDLCMPGMVSGGPNRFPADQVGKQLIPQGTPPMKCYVDHVACYSLNEITIYWNSPAVFVLAYLMNQR